MRKFKFNSDALFAATQQLQHIHQQHKNHAQSHHHQKNQEELEEDPILGKTCTDLIEKAEKDLIANCLSYKSRSLNDDHTITPSPAEHQLLQHVWRKRKKHSTDLLLEEDIFLFLLENGVPTSKNKIQVLLLQYDVDGKGGWDQYDFLSYWRKSNFFDQGKELDPCQH